VQVSWFMALISAVIKKRQNGEPLTPDEKGIELEYARKSRKRVIQVYCETVEQKEFLEDFARQQGIGHLSRWALTVLLKVARSGMAVIDELAKAKRRADEYYAKWQRERETVAELERELKAVQQQCRTLSDQLKPLIRATK
jgi:hypothetical protein